MNFFVTRNGKKFRIFGKFGNFHIYHEGFCVAFNIMTKNDAENWIWKHY